MSALLEIEETVRRVDRWTRFAPPSCEAVRSAASRGSSPEIRSALETGRDNIRAVAEAQLADERRVELEPGPDRRAPRGCRSRSAGVYAPGGTAAYPSTVLMGCIPAKVAGVGRVAVATPPPGRAAVSDADPRGGRDRRRGRGLRGRRRAGDRRACARHGQRSSRST